MTDSPVPAEVIRRDVAAEMAAEWATEHPGSTLADAFIAGHTAGLSAAFLDRRIWMQAAQAELRAEADRYREEGLAAERERWIAILAVHYLIDVICDPETRRDNPVCGCSQVFLGWHPSIGEARQAWIDHVAGLLAVEECERCGGTCECKIGNYEFSNPVQAAEIRAAPAAVERGEVEDLADFSQYFEEGSDD
jgi:hypothetical protein